MYKSMDFEHVCKAALKFILGMSNSVCLLEKRFSIRKVPDLN